LSSEQAWYSTQIFGVFIGAIIGFFISFIGKVCWNKYMSPDVRIEAVDVSPFHIDDQDQNVQNVPYQSNRIRTANRGKSAAIDCKVFLVIGTRVERVGWMLPTNKEAFTNNLNVEDEEYVDLRY
jgi:hypothetical protein